MIFHTALAGVFILLLLQIFISVFSVFEPRVDLWPRDVLTHLAAVVVGIAALWLHLFLREGIRDGSRVAWRVDVGFGILSILAAALFWAWQGLPVGRWGVLELAVFAVPVAVACALMWTPVRARFSGQPPPVDS